MIVENYITAHGIESIITDIIIINVHNISINIIACVGDVCVDVVHVIHVVVAAAAEVGTVIR